MSLRVGVTLLALSLLVALGCAELVVWRLWPRSAIPIAAPAPSVVAPPRPTPSSTPHLSTIIDLPGDPVTVQRGVVAPPRETHFALPLRPGANVSRAEAAGFYVGDTLVSTTGGYMGKFPAPARGGCAGGATRFQRPGDGLPPLRPTSLTRDRTMTAAKTRPPTPRRKC